MLSWPLCVSEQLPTARTRAYIHDGLQTRSREGAVSALTQKASGRIFALLLALAVVGVSLIIALRPAGAVNGVAYEDVDAADVCASFLDTIDAEGKAVPYEGETAIITVPRGGSNDRVFELTGLALGDRGVTVDLNLVSNRKDLTFAITAGTVEGVALVDGNRGDSGLFFVYESVDEGQATYTGNGNVKSIVLCYTPFYKGVLACGGTDSEVGLDPGDRASFVEVIRLEGDKNDCLSLLPYTLDITADDVKFLFPEEFAGENFFIRIDWAVSVGTADEILIGSLREVAVDDDVNFAPVQACEWNDLAPYLAPGEIPVLIDPPMVTHPDGVPICLVAQLLNGVQTQWYSGQFDPQWK